MKTMTWSKLKSGITIGGMALILCGTAAVAFTAPHHAAASPQPIVSKTRHATTVIALVNLADFKAALLEFQDGFPNVNDSMTSRQLIHEGQSFEDQMIKGAHVKVEIDHINFADGAIEAQENGHPVTYHFHAPADSKAGTTPGSLQIHDTSLDAIFALYGVLSGSGRTLLIHPAARQKARVEINANPKTKTAAVHDLEQVLNEKGFVMVPDGASFEQVLPKAMAKHEDSSTTFPTDSKGTEKALGIGIDFKNVPFETVRKLFTQTSGLNVIEEGRLPPVTLSLKSRSPLTRAEYSHAMAVLLGWQGIKLVKIDDKTVKAIHVAPLP